MSYALSGLHSIHGYKHVVKFFRDSCERLNMMQKKSRQWCAINDKHYYDQFRILNTGNDRCVHLKTEN